MNMWMDKLEYIHIVDPALQMTVKNMWSERKQKLKWILYDFIHMEF